MVIVIGLVCIQRSLYRRVNINYVIEVSSTFMYSKNFLTRSRKYNRFILQWVTIDVTDGISTATLVINATYIHESFMMYNGPCFKKPLQ